MLKHILFLILFSVAAILFQNQFIWVLKMMISAHTVLSHWLGVIFAFDKIGEVIQGVIALLCIPLLITALFSLLHFLTKKTPFPYIVAMVWFFWGVLLSSLLSHAVYVENPTLWNDAHIIHSHLAPAQQKLVEQNQLAGQHNQPAAPTKSDNPQK